MKYCEKCNVNVHGDISLCPLCQTRLKGEATDKLYPNVLTIFKQFKFFFKILILASVVIAVCSFATEIIIFKKASYSYFVLFGVVCFWISMSIAAKKLHSIPQNIVYQVVVASVLSFLWDYFTSWNGWSVDYVIPILSSAAMIALFVLSHILKMDKSDCILSLIVSICIGIVPLILTLLNIVTIIIPSVICISLSIISFVMLILFEGNTLLQEIKKRFHI